jgi:hypothetical protein
MVKRITVDLDDDVRAEIDARRVASGASLKVVVNEAMRRALASEPEIVSPRASGEAHTKKAKRRSKVDR